MIEDYIMLLFNISEYEMYIFDEQHNNNNNDNNNINNSR